MIINKIDNQTFCSKKFRLPIKDFVYAMDGIPIFSKKSYSVKEYSNPKAKELYKKAQRADTFKESAELYKQMGHYEIKKMNLIERIKDFFTIYI